MPIATPKDAAAVILLKANTDLTNPEAFWVKRNEKLAFLGGFHAFPGGQIDQSDSEVPVRNAPDAVTATMISGAARELFEELGVLVARGSESLTKGQRASLLDDLVSERMSWPALLNHYELELDATHFTFVGRWVTPPFSPRRFDTWFFLVTCPSKQQPVVLPGELVGGEWIAARAAHDEWLNGNVFAVPPTLHGLKQLSLGITDDLIPRFLSVPQSYGDTVRRIEFRPHYVSFPLRTPTRPPATHTNCYVIYTSKEFLIIDPGSPYEDEQHALTTFVDELIFEGRSLREVLLTHLHPDHVGGVNALRAHLGSLVTVAAHADTANSLKDIVIDRLIKDDEVITLTGEPSIQLQALHTPGHARGHLCFHDAERGVLLSGDNIVGLGSVLIDPPEGDMAKYLDSLHRLQKLPNLKLLLGGHGPATATPYQKIAEYIQHRLEREANILAAVREGVSSPSAIVERVYTDVSPKAYPLAERAVIAHLEKLQTEGAIQADGEAYVAV